MYSKQKFKVQIILVSNKCGPICPYLTFVVCVPLFESLFYVWSATAL